MYIVAFNTFDECPQRCDGDPSAFTLEQFSLTLSKVVENELEALLLAKSSAWPKVSAVNIILGTRSCGSVFLKPF